MIRLWWIGETQVDGELMEHARTQLAAAFRDEVSLGVRPGAPADAYDPRRNQHLSGRLLKWLGEEDAAGRVAGDRVLGVTDRDLFIPILTFVFGEAQLGGRAAVVSLSRLVPGPQMPRVAGLLRSRLAKECVHELGHAYGLRHCDSARCAMGRSATVLDVDGKDAVLCGDCRARLKDFKSRGSQAP